MKKSIGKPCEGKLHARFDEGGADSSEMQLSWEVIIIKRTIRPYSTAFINDQSINK